jgi:hypothetical protein
LCALVLAEAKARKRTLAVAELRGAVIDTVRRDPPAGTVWDNRYGMGRVSASAAVAHVTTAVQPIATARKPAKRPPAVYLPEAPLALGARATGRGLKPAEPASVRPAAKARHRTKPANRRV